MTTTTLPTWAEPGSVAGRAAEPVLEIWDQLIHVTAPSAGTDRTPSPPEPARRWLAHAVSPEAAPARVVVLQMTGHIKLGRWLPFRAVQVVAPPHGFVWIARAGWGRLSFTGFDRFANGEGQMRWLLGGRVPLMTASGPDITRSAAGRVAIEAICLPPSFTDVRWEPPWGHDSATALRLIGDEETRVELRVGDDGRLTSVRMQRWSAPDKRPWGLYPFGGIVEEEATFNGITIPSRLRIGYWIGTNQWAKGEFFRCRITDAAFLP